jgi:hypothetical protein
MDLRKKEPDTRLLDGLQDSIQRLKRPRELSILQPDVRHHARVKGRVVGPELQRTQNQ